MPRMRKPFGRLFVCNHGQRGLVKISDERGHFLLAGIVFVARMNRRNWKAFAVRVGVGQRAFKSLAAKDDDEAMLLAGLDEDFSLADFLTLAESSATSFSQTSVAILPARRSVTIPLRRAWRNSRGADVAGFQFHAEAERLDDAAADLKFQRVVAEESEMPGPLPGVMPGATGIMRPCAESLASLSRFGVVAASSGVR